MISGRQMEALKETLMKIGQTNMFKKAEYTNIDAKDPKWTTWTNVWTNSGMKMVQMGNILTANINGKQRLKRGRDMEVRLNSVPTVQYIQVRL